MTLNELFDRKRALLEELNELENNIARKQRAEKKKRAEAAVLGLRSIYEDGLDDEIKIGGRWLTLNEIADEIECFFLE